MHAITIVAQILRTACPHIHQSRLRALLDGARAGLRASSHTLSNLARALAGNAAMRHRVKRMDRLLGNRALHREIASVYAAMLRQALHGNAAPLIVVDWSDLNKSRGAQLIRASLALKGRSLTLYEEVHSMKAATTPAVHKAFLAQIKAMLPTGCQPIVITDAGFRSPWFRAVEAIGWHWIGRSRNRDLVRAHGSGSALVEPPWVGCKSLYANACSRALDLGLFDCVRNHPHVHRLVLVKRAAMQRRMKTVSGQRCRSTHSKKQASAQTEPWLLGVSVSLAHLSAQAVVNVYAQRMQIEQAFRDTKSARFGLGFEHSRSRTIERLAVLALIASLVAFVLHLIGQCAINLSLQYALQLTNRKTRAEISVIRIGQLLLQTDQASFTHSQLREVWQAWPQPHPALQI